jgi:superfamily II DNA/RNA helicase
MCVCVCVVLVLVPTRELALQTSAVLKQMGKHLKMNVVVTTGGTVLKASPGARPCARR